MKIMRSVSQFTFLSFTKKGQTHLFSYRRRLESFLFSDSKVDLELSHCTSIQTHIFLSLSSLFLVFTITLSSSSISSSHSLSDPIKLSDPPSQAHSFESSGLCKAVEKPLQLAQIAVVELVRLSSLRPSQALTLNHFKMTKDNWPPEENRFFFELYVEERRKRNRTSTSVNKIGKQNIMKAFEERFKRGYDSWMPFKNKWDTSRKKYTKFRRLPKNRTGLGFDNLGRIVMSDDGWYECKKICGVTKTRAEGLSAQHEETSLSSRVDGDDGDEADSQPAANAQALETETQPVAQTHSENSRAKRKLKDVVESCDRWTAALELKNKIAERMLEREVAFSIENVLLILNALPGVREWSPLYEAAIELLIDSEGSRRGFITMKTDEAKTKFLELRTKIKRDD